MEKIPITAQLTEMFRALPETLIFEGYCSNFDDVEVWRDGDSYALIARTDITECCIRSASEQFVLQVTQMLGGTVKFCGVDPAVTQILQARHNFEWLTHCGLYVWNGQPLAYKCRCDVRPMSEAYARQISDGTHYHAALDDIRLCLARHPSAAVYIEGRPVSWCLCHREKSLGMLFTLPQYRRQGYALEVMTSLCNSVIARGDVPYAYIVTDNLPSQRLAAKYNLDFVKLADYFQLQL